MATKKILVPIDLQMPERTMPGFLYPNVDSEYITSFLEIKGNKEWEVGMVAFVGKEISKDDVLAKIVDSGKKIKSVDYLLQQLDEYLSQIASFKIGDIVGIKPSKSSFELMKLQKPQRVRKKLP